MTRLGHRRPTGLGAKVGVKVALVVACMSVAGCSAFASASRTESPPDPDRTVITDEEAQAPAEASSVDGAPVVPLPEAPAAPTTSQAPSIRDGDDIGDIGALAARMSEGAAGEPEWIEVFAELRTRSWLATRYPGRYVLTEIYSEEWAAGHPSELERESLELGVYIDEPLPKLLSVHETRRLGDLVELAVILEAGEASIRQTVDDLVLGTLPGGGTRSGLFTLGQSSSTGRWRIYSVTEPQVTAGSPGEDSKP